MNKLDILEQLVALAVKQPGVDAADAVLFAGEQLSLRYRLGQREELERSENLDINLRVFSGKKQVSVSGNDVKLAALQKMAETGAALVKELPEDPFCGLPDASLYSRNWQLPDLYDSYQPDISELVGLALRAEDAALAEAGVTNSNGASVASGTHEYALVTSNGFAGGYRSSGHSLSVSVVAEKGHSKETDYAWSHGVYFNTLESPEKIGKKAAERATSRLFAKKMPSGVVPVVFDPRISRSVLGYLAGAINGASVARGASFLKNYLGKRILPAHLQVVDNPLLARGVRSRPFDAEGLAVVQSNIIDQGYLTSWILDSRSARQLGLKPNGHAARGGAGAPSPAVSNFYLSGGRETPHSLLAGIKQGFYVTDMMGTGVNLVTGDFSRGASGFWIENGELAFPVTEMTVAGHLLDIFARMEAANDLTHEYGIDCPTLRVDGLTVAGS